MADIFISYSKQDPENTKALAANLEARGYSVWWDTSLLPGERFPEKIRQEIEAAKVVIVIWSEGSAASEWVYAEAQLAQGLNKLITTRVPGLDLNKVPMPFGARHIEPISNLHKLYASLAARGISPTGRSAPVEEVKAPSPQHPENAAALYERGKEHFYGRNGVPQDYAEAVRLYRTAGSLGHAEAFHTLGWMYEKGRGVTKDATVASQFYKEAAELRRKAADLGDAHAMQELGSMYLHGEGVSQNATEAKRLFRQAGDLGDSEALRCLGGMTSGEGSKDEAVSLYRRAGDLGHAYAMEYAALCYKKGEGVEKDPEEAQRLYRKLADIYRKRANSGDAIAFSWLSRMYKEGKGVPKDDAESARLLRKKAEIHRKAADLGKTRDMILLGEMYEEGRGVGQDDAEALHFYRKASDLGDPEAIYNLAHMYERGRGVREDLIEATRLYHKAADLGDPVAMRSLSTIYLFGAGGVERSLEDARYWLQKLVDSDFLPAEALELDEWAGSPSGATPSSANSA
jgi:uncharacterized protein